MGEVAAALRALAPRRRMNGGTSRERVLGREALRAGVVRLKAGVVQNPRKMLGAIRRKAPRKILGAPRKTVGLMIRKAPRKMLRAMRRRAPRKMLGAMRRRAPRKMAGAMI